MAESSGSGDDPIEAVLNRLRTLELEVEVHKQYPDAALLLKANKDITLKRIDYLDDHMHDSGISTRIAPAASSKFQFICARLPTCSTRSDGPFT
jgi:hypothetical protein